MDPEGTEHGSNPRAKHRARPNVCARRRASPRYARCSRPLRNEWSWLLPRTAEVCMRWMIGLALLASYYVGEGAFQLVAVLSLIIVAVSIVATVVGLKTVKQQELL